MGKFRENFRIWMACVLFMTVAVVVVLENVSGVQAEQAEKRVLFLSSYSYGWDTVQIQIEGIKAGIGSDIVLDYEFMDRKRLDNDEWAQIFYEGFRYRMSKVQPYDAVILGDDAALEFALQYREELFDNVPLIFEGINNEELALEVSKDPLITGILEKLSVEENIRFALTLYPDAKKVMGIFDDTLTGQAERKSFYKNASLFPQLEFDEIDTSKLSSSELRKALSSVEEDTILIYVVMTEDADGVTYTNSQSIRLISEYCRVPAFRMVSGGIGEGLLGGNIVSMELSGQIAAEIATEIVNGRNPADYNVMVDSPNVYCIDEAVMRKFNIDLSLIPEGAEIINHKESFVERNREALIPGTIIIILMLLLIALITRDNFRKNKLASLLWSETKSLEKATLHDELTGLSNRKCLNIELAGIIQDKVPSALVMMDIDDFKFINDTYGHRIGDLALKKVSSDMMKLACEDFLPFRLAGDEFTIIIKSNDKNVINDYIKRLMHLLSEESSLDGVRLKISASMGVAVFPKDADNVLDLVACSDKAMYHIKKSCKNSFCYYDEEEQTAYFPK